MPDVTREFLCDSDAESAFIGLTGQALAQKPERGAVIATRKPWGLRLRVYKPNDERRLGEAVLDIRARSSERGTILTLASRRHPDPRTMKLVALGAVTALALVSGAMGGLKGLACAAGVGAVVALSFLSNAISGSFEDEDDWERLERFAAGTLPIRPL